MMFYCNLAFHLAVVFIAPIFVVGIVTRVKSLWAGRRGPLLYQSWFDLVRLLHKTPVYSEVTSWIFPIAPLVILATTITASLLSPIVPGFAPLGFSLDFVAFAYLLGLGRLFLMLSALDTGSAFEGMGASREATFSALVEPVFLLGLGTLSWLSLDKQSFQDLVMPGEGWSTDEFLRIAIVAAMLVVLLIESSRVPADDPATHLELTMVHEVMILDHSGPELATVQYASALKMTVLAGIMAAMVNPFSVNDGPVMAILSMLTSLGLIGVVAIVVGLIESLTARLRFRALPMFIFSALMAVLVSLAVVVANQGAFR